jgi:hypothetical protein
MSGSARLERSFTIDEAEEFPLPETRFAACPPTPGEVNRFQESAYTS